MDHPTIEETHVVERYLRGQLSPEEAEHFEDHYLDCPECLENLELGRRLHRGLLQVATEEAVQAEVVRRAGLLARLTRLGRSRQLGLALAAVAVVLLAPAGLLFREVRRLGSELAEARAQASHTPPPATGGGELAAARQALAAEQAHARQVSEEMRREKEKLTAELDKALQPQINTAVYSLSPERSGPGAPGDGEPTTRIALGPSPGWIVLSLDLGGNPAAGTFRATLRHGGATIWTGGGLAPDPQGSLVLSLPPSLLAPGDYTLAVDSATPGGRTAAVARFTFRVRR